MTTPLSPEQMKAAVTRFADEVVNKGNLAVADDIYSDEWLDHDTGHPDFGRGAQAAKQEIAIYRQGFPDIHYEIEESVVEGNVIVYRWRATGTHLGKYLGVRPTKKKLRTAGISFERFGPDGKIVETWNVNDRMAIAMQLGVKGMFWAAVNRSWRFGKSSLE
jgi:predicted ester cyclase